MLQTIHVPRLNANEDELLIADILVSVGDEVEIGQPVFVIESSKATEDILAQTAGYVRRIAAKAGQVLAVGAPVCFLTDTADEPLPDLSLGETSPSQGKVAAEPAKLSAKQRLKAKRAAPRVAAHVAASASDSLEGLTDSSEIPWVKQMRGRIDEHCGPDLQRREQTVDRAVACPCAADGVFLAEGVTLEEGATLTARRIYLDRNAHVGRNTSLKADTIYLGAETRISGNVSLQAGEILIEDGVLIAGGTAADLSGGQTAHSRLIVGAASLIAGGVNLNTASEILLERECAISPRAMLFTHSFWQSVLEGYHPLFQSIRICENAWIGAGCQVLPGITVGPGSIVMSNSTVVQNVPAACLAGGVPAKVIRRDIRRELTTSEKLRIVKQLLREFAESLRFKNCEVASSSEFDAVMVSRSDIGMRSIVIAGPDGPAPTEHPERAIFLTLVSPITPLSSQSVFDLEERTFSGTEDRITHELRNFLRRRGIRFAPYAWNSDYRKGILA